MKYPEKNYTPYLMSYRNVYTTGGRAYRLFERNHRRASIRPCNAIVYLARGFRGWPSGRRTRSIEHEFIAPHQHGRNDYDVVESSTATVVIIVDTGAPLLLQHIHNVGKSIASSDGIGPWAGCWDWRCDWL